MKNILILCLTDKAFLYSLGPLIESLKQNYKCCHIGLLTETSNKKYARIFSHLDSTYEINKRELKTIMTKEIYSNSFAIETLKKSLNNIEVNQWDLILNFSTDPFSMNLASYLSKNNGVEVRGLKYGNFGSIEFSNDWSILLKEISSLPYMNLKLCDFYHRIVEITPRKEPVSLHKNPKHQEVINKNFAILKRPKTKSRPIKLVAIKTPLNIDRNDQAKDVCKLVNLLNSTDDLKPIFLINPNNEREKYIAEEINQQLTHSCTIIEADDFAILSVLNNMELLITSDSNTKSLASLIGINTLFIANEVSNPVALIQSNSSGAILTSCSINNSLENKNRISPTILFKIIEKLISKNTNPKEFTKIPSHYLFYSNYLNEDSLLWKRYCNNKDEKWNELISTFVISSLLSRNELQYCEKHLSEIDGIDTVFIKNWIKKEKNFINKTLTVVLVALRSIGQKKLGQSKINSFLPSFEKLIELSYVKSCLSVPLKVLHVKIENYIGPSKESNSNYTEQELFSFKKQIQRTLNILNFIEKNTFKIKLNQNINIQDDIDFNNNDQLSVL